ncbi:MAG: phenylalanine--tRNA ligase subunit beta [Ignavibacteriae bacterium]|nr:phenylalanine--tRNA ligase subunit beta [Ignavibacteriota bacterium]
MKVSLTWLRRYIDLPESPEQIAALLTGTGLEVESIEDHARQFDGIVVGCVVTCEKHPKADKLSICTVDDGIEVVQVICGAPNVAAGQKVPFARIGAWISTAGFRIEKRTIRGAESSGMICSSSELGLNADHSGIMVLPDTAQLGQPFSEYLGKNDVSLEIGITPNRGDALSHIGVARDLAAVLGRLMRIPAPVTSAQLFPEALPIHIADPVLCPRYSGAIIRGVTVKPSPAWLARLLEAAGVRSINSVVDVTNFIMLELGQPMHAFDLSALAGPEIRVRSAVEGENFTTLDGRTHTLRQGAILICDAEKPVALGGVMGGQNSEINNNTVDVLLESAHFHPSSIRKTARAIAAASESSYRFERTTDPDGTMVALRRAIDILLEVAGGKLIAVNDNYTHIKERPSVVLRPERVRSLLGIDISDDRIGEILNALQYKIRSVDNRLEVTVPGFRSDIDREVDLIEEIARIHGYDNIPSPSKIEITTARQYDDFQHISMMRASALGLGLDEVVSSSLVPRDFAHIGHSPERTLDVLNPVSTERPALRSTILSSLLEAADLNLRNGAESMRIFEIGSTYVRKDGGGSGLAGVDEKTMIGILLTGDANTRSWHTQQRGFDIFDMKGLVTSFLARIHIDIGDDICYDRSESLTDSFLPIDFNGAIIGRMMEVPQNFRSMFSIERPVFYAEFEAEALRSHMYRDRKYAAPSRFPAVKRDLAFLLPVKTRAADILVLVKEVTTAHLVHAEVIDVFTHESFGQGNKSLALSLQFQAEGKTLVDADIAPEMDAIVSAVEKTFSAKLRS